MACLTLDVANAQEPDALLAQLLVPSLIFLLMGSTRVSCALGGSSSNCLSGRDFSNAFAEADAPIMPMSP